ncbi:MAG: sigma 54-dependent Fis family transcriptional regulator [Polyangiaceae bacterium]|nr:sigma 54-dependent Fis family transcriptional regulator [Polyangiaceae bacterium]MCW5789347.1 sigma 54-dependent Fis family transcriptional regulator [Polyangiaceae bacterium]
MSINATSRLERSKQLEIETLAVEVIEGADAGLRVDADSEELTVGTAANNDLELTDPTVSGYHLELRQREDGIHLTDLGSTNGTWVGGVRLRQGVIPPGTILNLGRTSLKVVDGTSALVEVHTQNHLGDLFGQNEAMRRVMAKVQRVARAQVPVLVIGESGTGKELVARALHDESDRSQGPFVTVDCGALAPNLVASELFGHERGAFTGAERQHIGAFERASGGTLFLDEIGELPLDLQPQLLGALERRRFNRVGGRQEVSVDVRVVCATNRDLREEVNAGSFRMDLYYRVGVVVLRLPPLRERLDDLPLLIGHFLREAGHAGRLDEVAPEHVLSELRRHSWPGNVRELRNWVEATLAMGEAQELFQHDEARSNPASFDRVLDLPYKDARGLVLQDFEAQYVRHLFEKSRGNVTHAARDARMDRSYLIKLLQRHGVK